MYIRIVLFYICFFDVTSFLFFLAYIGTGQVMGWGNKAIEIRNVETGHLDGVFMHKKAQRLKFLCERNEKVNVHLVITWIICRQMIFLALKFVHMLTLFSIFIKI